MFISGGALCIVAVFVCLTMPLSNNLCTFATDKLKNDESKNNNHDGLSLGGMALFV